MEFNISLEEAIKRYGDYLSVEEIAKLRDSGVINKNEFKLGYSGEPLKVGKGLRQLVKETIESRDMTPFEPLTLESLREALNEVKWNQTKSD